MTGQNALWAEVYTESSLCAALALDTRLTANQRARLSAINTAAISASLSSPSDDLELIFCLKQVMFRDQSGP